MTRVSLEAVGFEPPETCTRVYQALERLLSHSQVTALWQAYGLIVVSPIALCSSDPIKMFSSRCSTKHAPEYGSPIVLPDAIMARMQAVWRQERLMIAVIWPALLERIGTEYPLAALPAGILCNALLL